MSGPLRNIFWKCAGGFPHAGRRHWRGSCGIRCQVGKTEVLATKAKVNPFIFIKNKWCVISSEGLSALEKTPCYVLRRLCCPSRLVLPVGTQIKKKLTCCLCGSSGRVQEPATDNISCLLLFKCKKVSQTSITICSGLPHPTRWLTEQFAEGRRALKAVKALWGLISRPILYLCNFF